MTNIKKGKKLIIELGQMPPNVLTPKVLAGKFQHSIHAALDEGLVGLRAVGGNKAYMGNTVLGGGNKITALIGKGVTFDSGGISIKGGANMKDMKFDMLGAATVLAVGNAYIQKPSSTLAILAPCAENTFHDNTYRPGDILTYPDGTRVEVDNTDAEGRLILADAILKVRGEAGLIITIATLTGAAAAAVGEATAVLSNDDGVAEEFLAVAEAEGERAWRLPLWKEHREAIDIKWEKEKKKKGDTSAFISNCVRGGAGASTAAAFLEVFVGNTPWLHLDIAGSAYKDGVPTGAMLKSLVTFLNGRD